VPDQPLGDEPVALALSQIDGAAGWLSGEARPDGARAAFPARPHGDVEQADVIPAGHDVEVVGFLGVVGVDVGPIEVEVHGERATARFHATLSDGSGRWIPDRRAVLEVETGWRREGGDWTCYNASWSVPDR
jgi:hypothetical protein